MTPRAKGVGVLTGGRRADKATRSGQPEETYFSDGITEDIITGLARFRSLFVIARNSSFAFRGKQIDLAEVGRKLGVSYILEGSVRRAGQRMCRAVTKPTTGAPAMC